MPKDSFTRTNGGATEEYNIGNYKGNTYGKCMLFIWNGYETCSYDKREITRQYLLIIRKMGKH